MTNREYNKEWNNFVNKTERGYVSFALRYTKELEDAKDIAYSVYGKLCQKDYDFTSMEYAGLTAIRRALTNRFRDFKLQKNAATVLYLEDKTTTSTFVDRYSDIESELILKELDIQVEEPKKSCNKENRNGGAWPYVENYMGF